MQHKVVFKGGHSNDRASGILAELFGSANFSQTLEQAPRKKARQVRIYRAQEPSGEASLEQLTLGRFQKSDYA